MSEEEQEAIEAAEIESSIRDFMSPHSSRGAARFARMEFYKQLVKLIDKRIAVHAALAGKEKP